MYLSHHKMAVYMPDGLGIPGLQLVIGPAVHGAKSLIHSI